MVFRVLLVSVIYYSVYVDVGDCVGIVGVRIANVRYVAVIYMCGCVGSVGYAVVGVGCMCMRWYV